MVFSSLVFLFAYLPVALLLYYLTPHRWKNSVLFVLSLLFYAWGEPIYLFLMAASITSAYVFGFQISKNRLNNPKSARIFLILSIAVNLSFLFFFKYYNFFAAMLSLPLVQGLTLPIGISFYTFQIISYSIDLWCGDCTLQKNYISFGTYVTLFPQLIAGPIVRYQDIDRQLTCRRESAEQFAKGIERLVTGLAKKILLGDALAAGHLYCKEMLTLSPSVLGAWLTVIFYTLHLYYDFSGYSDMAIGLGHMLGFSFPENFNYPYISKSITEFWRRWHITLSLWFREYVYIPLGGNRKGKAKQCRNIAIVWLLTGLWHGASWNFVLWGLYFCVILICEHLFLRKMLEKTPSVIRHFYTMVLVLISFLIFSYTDLSAGKQCFLAFFGIKTLGFTVPSISHTLLHALPLLFAAAVGATPLPKRLFRRMSDRYQSLRMASPLFLAGLLILCTAYLVDSTFSPFAYLNF